MDYTYDAFGSMTSAVASDATPLSSYAYAPNDGRLTHLLRGGADWGDGSAHVEIGFTWEDDGDLAQQALRLRADGTSRIDFDYTYNAAGQLITQDANAPGWLWDPAAIATETIAYDPANALDQYTAVDGLVTSTALRARRTYPTPPSIGVVWPPHPNSPATRSHTTPRRKPRITPRHAVHCRHARAHAPSMLICVVRKTKTTNAIARSHRTLTATPRPCRRCRVTINLKGNTVHGLL